MVRILLCGRFAVVLEGQPIESRLPGRQGRLLVAYLATYRGQPVERTVLLDTLWPEGGAGAGLGIGGTELPAAERAARRLVAHAPLAETGHQLLMRALSARGDAAAALAAHDKLRQLLRDELGVSPCPATQALHGRLLRG